MYIETIAFCLFIFNKFATSAGIVHMTQNSLNEAKFYELRRSPQRIKDSFEIRASGNFTPTVICDSDQIGLSLNENFADIRMFAADHSSHPACLRRFSLELEPQFVTRIDGPCGVRRVYKGVPSSSVTYSIRLIVSHNPSEPTEFDKIYDVTCSLHLKTMEVKAAYDIISPKTTTLTSSTVQTKVGPKCKYSLHHDRVGGPRTASAHVGEVIYHRWKCAAPHYQKDAPGYIFKVYSCVVHDEKNRTYSIIDDDGCSLDEEIIPTPEYDIENGVIYTPSKAFRFANSNHVHFKCMISVCSAVDPSCRNSVPPKCKKRKQHRRQLPEEMTIEQRLLRIHELMKVKRENLTVEVGTARRRNGMVMNNSWSENSSRVEVEAEPVVVNRDYEMEKLHHILHSYKMWTWIMCTLNVFLVVLCLLVTFRLLKNKYIMDIKDKTNTVFRRVPF
ncbi:CRE-CUTL-22 protein [Caenorhabditis remanei]|uniref:CRE-CUTL-22 protein n=1 Tax=Caenorhabditis remanei TaxID=31234 RepID=E3MBJ5_CAERE|nr:CRE-CUTL-22 protein [Caenorhabditis remanei]